MAEYDTISYLRGGMDWDVFHPPFTNIVLSLCAAVWKSMWLPAVLQVLWNAMATAMLAGICFGERRISALVAVGLVSLEPVSAFHSITLLSEGWYMPVIMHTVTWLLARAKGARVGIWMLVLPVALAPWIRLQATVEVGLLLLCFGLLRETRKMAIWACLVLVCSALLMHVTYRYRFSVSPFDASVRSDHASAIIPDQIPQNPWDFIYGYQEMYNTCITHDIHADEHARHRACLDLIGALPGVSFPQAVMNRLRLNVPLAVTNPFLSEHQQHMLDMTVPDQVTASVYGTSSWPMRSRAILPLPGLLPWLTLVAWLMSVSLAIHSCIKARTSPGFPMYLWLSAIPVLVMVAFFYKERFLSAWHAIVPILVVSGLIHIPARSDGSDS